MTITPEQQFLILLALIITLSGIGGWFLFGLSQKVKIILGGGKGDELPKDTIRRIARVEVKLEEIEPRLKLTEDISKISVQKVGFLRFNPFNDTGGDNSFILALLDRKNNGAIVTSLYSREGTRLYAKKVEGGETKQQLSEEEHKVLNEALNPKP